jgi:hypothetical protein
MQRQRRSSGKVKVSKPEVKEKNARPARQNPSAKRTKKEQTPAEAGSESATAARQPVRNPPSEEQKTPQQLQQECTEQVLKEMENIFAGLIGKAKEGSFQHAKFLLDFAGVEGAAGSAGSDASSPDQQGESLVELLLRRLDGAALRPGSSGEATETLAATCGVLPANAATGSSGVVVGNGQGRKSNGAEHG